MKTATCVLFLTAMVAAYAGADEVSALAARHGLGARNGLQLVQDSAIRLRNLFSSAAGQPRIDGEHEDVLPVVSRILGPEIAERPQEQTGRHEQDQ